MFDLRNCLTRETREVLDGVVKLSRDARCFSCGAVLGGAANPFTFIVIKDYLCKKDDTLKFSCLKCCRTESQLMDVIEVYPTLRVHDVKKLMYYRLLKRFMFDFVDGGTVLCKRYAVTDGLQETLIRMFGKKRDNEEVHTLRLLRGSSAVAELSIHALRVDYGRQFNLDKPSPFTKKLAQDVRRECAREPYVLEVFHREYEEYSPFVVYYNRGNNNECVYCAGKVCPRTGHPVFHCSLCGPTDPNYFTARATMMLPFWNGKYDYNKIYWKTMKRKGLSMCMLMLYGVDTRREIL